MYIANTTKQRILLNFRVPETTKIAVLEIQSGQQVQTGDRWTIPQRNSVVEFLESFGAKPASAVNGKLSEYSGMLYSLDKPVASERIQNAHETVVAEQMQTSSDELTKAALGVDAGTRDKRTKRRRAKQTTLSVTQDTPRGERPAKNRVNFSLSVAEDGHDNPGLSR